MREGWNVWTVANGVSLARLVLVWPVTLVILGSERGASLPGLALFLVAAVSDALDGYLARRLGEVSKFGELLDPVADKALGIAVMGALAAKGALPWWALWLLAGKEGALVLGGAVLVGGRKEVVAARTLGKAATVVLFAGLAVELAGLLAFGRSVVIAGVLLSVAAGVDYALLAARKARSGRRNRVQ